MSSLRATLNAPEYLHSIAKAVREPGEGLSAHRDLPGKVSEIIRILDGIERKLRDPSEPGRLERSQLPKTIDDVIAKQDAFRNVVVDVGREIGRATSKRVPLEGIVPQTRAIIDALEAIEQLVRPKDFEKMHFSQLQRRIENLLLDNHDKYMSSKDLLTRIAHELDPSETASGKIEDLPLKVAELVNNQAFNRGTSRAKSKSISGQVDRNERNDHEEDKIEWLKTEVSRLRESLQEQCQRNEELKYEAKETNDSLKSAIEEAENHQNNLTTEHRIDILKLKAIERELRESHTRSLNRLQAEQVSAVAEIQQRQGQETKEIMAKHEGDLETLQKDWLRRVSNSEQKLTEQKAAFAKKAQVIQLQYSEELAEQRQNYSAEKRETKNQHQLEKKGLLDRIRDLGLTHAAELKKQREHAQEIESQLNQKLAEEGRQHDLARQRARKRAKEHELQLSTLETQYTQKFSEQERLHSEALGRADEKRREQLATLQAKHETHLEAERMRIIETEATWELKLAQVAQTYEAEEINWKQALDREKARSMERLDEDAQRHKIEIEKLESQRQKLLELFTKEDQYSGLTDTDIVRGGKLSIVGFTNMVSKVTTFSEWEWREDRKIWPKDTMTALVGTKQRRLKKLILGDAIWGLVFQLIFCSPFRILGEEGKNLEKDWSGSFPSDDEESSNEYRWPTPTFFCEKYRWETCEAALDSLTKPSSPYGPLRSSFVNHQAQFNDRFLETVEAYVELTEKKEQELLKFLTEAVRMWLVLCTQRYRIRMIIPGSNESDPEKKMKLAQEQNDLKFTVAPRLQRHGNAKGTQLQEVSVVSGCDGKVTTLHESQS